MAALNLGLLFFVFIICCGCFGYAKAGYGDPEDQPDEPEHIADDDDDDDHDNVVNKEKCDPFTNDSIFGRRKEGNCQQKNIPTALDCPQKTCRTGCRSDFSCPGNRKCCFNGCIYVCKNRFFPKKPGHCPTRMPGNDWDDNSLQRCKIDHQCPGSQKCCDYRNIRVCRKSVSTDDDTEQKNYDQERNEDPKQDTTEWADQKTHDDTKPWDSRITETKRKPGSNQIRDEDTKQEEKNQNRGDHKKWKNNQMRDDDNIKQENHQKKEAPTKENSNRKEDEGTKKENNLIKHMDESDNDVVWPEKWHKGSCPRRNTRNCTSPIFSCSQSRGDSDCRDRQKCCLTGRCHFRCTDMGERMKVKAQLEVTTHIDDGDNNNDDESIVKDSDRELRRR